MTAYYNEFDPKAAEWLRELINMGMIAPGIVDERSIVDVDWRDLHGFTQCHFFAGIGGWSYALRLAEIPDDTPLWTASLPCQPFSSVGKQLGKQDERHLLPHFLELVKKCKPDTIFGEQVERAIGHGWLDDLQATMEAESYAVGHCVLGAHSIGAAHIRQRLYWVANSIGIERTEQGNGCGNEKDARQAGGVNAYDCEYESHDWLYCRDNKYRPIESGLKPLVDGVPRGMVHSSDPRNTQEARAMRLKGYGNAIVPPH